MGKINLNSIVYNEKLTKEEINKHITQEEIFSYYLGDSISSNKKFCSPLRNDSVPSFSLFYHRDGEGILMFYDFATKDCGDYVVFVRKLFDLEFKDALRKIVFDFGLSNIKVTADKRKLSTVKRIIQRKPVNIGIKKRNWKQLDRSFWSRFGIKKSTLIKFNVVPIEYIFFNGNAVKVDKHGYAYLEYKDDRISYKIYQPYNEQFKWINNANYSVHQGYTQLPGEGDLLIITKSLKDVMSLYDVMGTSAIGLQSESVMMKGSVMKEYKSRFKKVVCLFDNDKAGKSLSLSFSSKYKVPYFFMPEMEGVTDFSDLVKIIGIEKAKVKFNTLIENEIK